MEINNPSQISRSGASFHRGNSKQNYSTPADFRTAIIKRFGFPAWDLAASAENYFGPKGKFFDEENNSLLHEWHKIEGLLWLNCPFGNIEPWAKKCSEEANNGAKILFLVPCSVGSVWWALHVHQQALVFFLRPRLSFDGMNSFPKDCALIHYGAAPSYDLWKWK
jgi:hypothetical protein